MIQKTGRIPLKIGPGKHKNGDSKENAKEHRKITEHVENGAPNGNAEVYTFWSPGSFFLCQAALGAKTAPKASPKGSRDQSEPRFPQI